MTNKYKNNFHSHFLYLHIANQNYRKEKKVIEDCLIIKYIPVEKATIDTNTNPAQKAINNIAKKQSLHDLF